MFAANMAVIRTVLIALTFAIALTDGQSSVSTYGTYFRMVFIDNFVDYPVDRPVDLYVCNQATIGNRVNITIPYLMDSDCEKSTVQTIMSRQCYRFKLCQDIRHTYVDGSLANKVVEVFSQEPISVQGFNVEKFSADSYSILPWELNNHVYYVMSYTLQSIQTQFAIVAKEPAIIRITIPDRASETITVDYNGLRYTNGETITFELQPETTYLAQSAGDLTGVKIQSSRKISVFTGNVRSYQDHNQTSRDHLVEQVLGTHRWGKEFIYVPTPRAVPGDVVKMIAYGEETQVELISSNSVSQIVIGMSPVTMDMSVLTHIRAQRAILVSVFIRSQNGKNVGDEDPADPSMYFLPSVDQYANEFYLPRFKDAEERDYSKVWVLLAVPENELERLMIDDNRVELTSLALVSVSRGRALPYRAGVVELTPNAMHRLKMSGGRRFMAIGYGASDRESFASTLGYQFDTFGCQETDMLEVPDNIDNDCDGTTDEETCGNGKDDDEDGLVDEDCKDYSVPPTQRDATGTSFAITFMSNIVRDLPAGYVDQVELYIAPLEPGTLVSVTSPLFNGEGHPTYNDVPASPGSVLQLAINPNMRQTPVNSVRLGKSTITNKGIKLVANKPVVVYGINKKQFSTDGFLALPINVLGSEYYAYCNSPVVIEDDRCQFAVVGVKNGTRINMVVQNGVTLDGIDNGQPIVGPTTHSVILDAYQVLEVQSVDDITGTRVYSDDDIHFSFFSGNIRTRVPSDKGSRDHLVEQLPSTDTWGNSFSTMAMPREADEGDLFKILAKDTNTEIIFSYFDDVQSLATEVFTLQPGEYHQIFMNNSSPVNIESDKPVLVIQITKSAPPNYLFNDPAAIVVIPESRWSREYRFVTPLSGKRQGNYQVSFNNYIVLAIRKEYREGLFIVDTEGREIDIGTRNDWVEMPGNPEIEGLVFRLPQGQGQTFISNLSPEATWMALLYGKANRETYGNAIGLNFFSSDITCTNVRMVSGDGIDNDCDGKIDEEMSNGVDDDGDGKVDEDLGLPPMGYTYIFTFEENLVEYPRNYALEIYVGAQSEVKSTCRMETPGKRYAPSYDVTTVVHEPLARADRIQFAVSAALRTMGTGVQRTSILVTCDQPVTLMGINKETFSADAFVVMEQSKLGMDYYTVSYSPATIQTQFAVVAVMNGTTNVIIAPKAPITWDDNEVQDVNVDLHRYEVFQAQSKDDLTGSRITANKPVAVFSGNIRTKVELSASRDHLASQLLPTTSWGTRFNLVPTWFRTVGDIFRVVAKDDNTRISWNGDARTLARAGDHTELKLRSTRAYSLTATRPIMVMQLIKSQASAYNSEPADPCWHAVAPVELYTNKSTVVTPLYSRGFYKDGEHFKNYLTIIVPEQFQNDIRINGVSVNSNPDVRYANTNERRIIRGSDYVAVDIILQKEGIGTYEIINVNPGVKFSGYLVGVADRESYCVLIGN